MKRLFLIVGLQVIAFWDVWRWYFSRAVYSWDQPWGVLALIAAIIFLVASRKPWPQAEFSPLILMVLTVFYALTYWPFGPLARATVAFTTLAISTSSLRFGKSFHAGLFGLLYLSLPTLPTLEFFGGYPLRVVVAKIASAILRMSGFAVIPEGTCLNWAGKLIWIDAPCSGIKMLWVGLFLTFLVLCLYELPLLKTFLLLPLVGVVILATNVFRAVALFYIEAGVLRAPSWGHEYAGVIAFVLEAAGIIGIVMLLRRRNVCVVATSAT